MNAQDRKLIRALMIVSTILVSLMVVGMLWVTLTNPNPASAPQTTASGGAP